MTEKAEQDTQAQIDDLRRLVGLIAFCSLVTALAVVALVMGVVTLEVEVVVP